MSSFKLPSDGRVIGYSLSEQPANGPIVLLSNSLCADYTSWDRVTSVIEKLGYRVLRYDQPGHGRSEAPKPGSGLITFSNMADDVYSLLEHLGIKSLHAWIGDSMGGIKAIYFTARYKNVINKLLVADSIAASPLLLDSPDVFTTRVEAVKKAGNMEQDLANTRARWFGEQWMAANPEEAARVTKSMASTTMEGFEACCAALSSKSFDLRPLYAGVGEGCNEALIVVGENDADLPVKMRDMQKQIEASLAKNGKKTPVRMELVKDAGHVPYIDGFEQFSEIVTRYLKE